jgi:hypothetical protein
MPLLVEPRGIFPETHYTGCYMGPRAGLGAKEKRIPSCQCWESSPTSPKIQLKVRPYTHWAIAKLNRTWVTGRVEYNDEKFINILTKNFNIDWNWKEKLSLIRGTIIILAVNWTLWKYKLDSTGSGQNFILDSFENNNEPSDSIEFGEWLNNQSDFYLLVLHPVAHLPMIPSNATEFRYANSPFFIFLLTHYMFWPLQVRYTIRCF